MGTVINRGTRGKPRWYVIYKDHNGKRRWVASGQPTKALARRFLDQIEARIANGQVGIEDPGEQPRCAELLERWAKGLRNRNAQDDRTRMRKHVLPEFDEQSRKKHVPWLQDDDIVRRLIDKLPTPVHYMFYLGHRSGMRTGEIAGFRMSDFDFLDQGVIRVRYSYDGPLEEDRDNEGKVKWVPGRRRLR